MAFVAYLQARAANEHGGLSAAGRGGVDDGGLLAHAVEGDVPTVVQASADTREGEDGAFGPGPPPKLLPAAQGIGHAHHRIGGRTRSGVDDSAQLVAAHSHEQDLRVPDSGSALDDSARRAIRHPRMPQHYSRPAQFLQAPTPGHEGNVMPGLREQARVDLTHDPGTEDDNSLHERY